MLAWHRAAVSAAGVSVPQGAGLLVPGDRGWSGRWPQPSGALSTVSPQSGSLCLKRFFRFRERKAEAAVLRVHHQQQGHVSPLMSHREMCPVPRALRFRAVPGGLKGTCAPVCGVRRSAESWREPPTAQSAEVGAGHPEARLRGSPGLGGSALLAAHAWLPPQGREALPGAPGSGRDGASWGAGGRGSSAAWWQGPDHLARKSFSEEQLFFNDS